MLVAVGTIAGPVWVAGGPSEWFVFQAVEADVAPTNDEFRIIAIKINRNHNYYNNVYGRRGKTRENKGAGTALAAQYPNPNPMWNVPSGSPGR